MDDADLALIIALDCSASVSLESFGLMASGCAAGLRDDAVVAGLLGGPLGASLSALMIWSGTGAQEVMVEWTRLSSPEALAAFAGEVENVPRTIRAGATVVIAVDDEVVALRLARDRGNNGGVQFVVTAPAAQDATEIGGIVLAETHI